MTRFRRALTVGALTTAAVTSLACASQASAAGTFTVNGGYNCYLNGPNQAKFFCNFDWTSTNGPYSATARVSEFTYGHVTEIDYYANTATVYGSCARGKIFEVTLTVTDSTGATGSGTDYGYCG